MSTYKQILLAERPKGEIVVGKTFKMETLPRPSEADLKDGQLLVETLYLSLDPAMRGWLNDTRSYLPPVGIGERMRGGAIARVLAVKGSSSSSSSSSFRKGDLAYVSSGWAEVAVVEAKEAVRCDTSSLPGVRPTDFIGVLGLTGLTAYFGLLEIGDPKPGELVVVSGAAGATGSVACQIALLRGARVVGIAGAEDKCEWLRGLGCTAALNYKDPDFKDRFREATRDYIDVFYDNVGGEQLDMALARAKPHARFVICGMISQYNSSKPRGPSNIMNVISMRIKMQGFVVFDFAAKYPQARKDLAGWLADGKIQRKEHIIRGGLEAAPQGLSDLFRGINTGKLIVEIKDEGTSSRL